MIVLITPTGARPVPFTLCAQWMKNQTYKGEVIWIIIDDFVPVTTLIVPECFRENWTILKVYPKPSWTFGMNTQGRNIFAGLEAMRTIKNIEAIFIIEDDDYYRPTYLERMFFNINNYSIVGERNTIYYNVQCRRYVTNPNIVHASLFQTAFTIDVLPIFERCLSTKFIDAAFWREAPNKHIFYENDLAVGIKGLPGRGGIGAGHNVDYVMKDDSNLVYLRALIGTDSENYETYYIGAQIRGRGQLFKSRR